MKRYLRRILPFPLYRVLIELRKLLFATKCYKLANDTDIIQSEVICIVDHRIRNGGIGDRFRNIVSVYKVCKEHGIPFKLYFNDGFDLNEFLLPNKYNWTISRNQISSSLKKSRILFLHSVYKSGIISFEEEAKYQNQRLTKYISLLKQRPMQLHVFGNAHLVGDNEFSELFKELFRPTELLQLSLDKIKCDFPSEYSAVVCRFQNLLGDFKERNSIPLDNADRERLISECLEKIKTLYKDGYFNTKTLLVTSDSSLFLSHVSKLPFVKTIPGKVVHVDYVKDATTEQYMKSFLDLFMLSKANSITLLQTHKMYPSGFPQVAAQIGNIPFNVVKW